MRITLDTNIIVSAVLFPESKLAKSTLELSDRYKLVICDRVIAELRNVMQRKFPERMLACEQFLRKLDFELTLSPADIDSDVYPKIRDKDDYPILAAAIIADVDVFISGDGDFSATDVERPEIMTINEFTKMYL